jgi:hypothetical protein
LLTLYFSNHEPDAISARFMELLADCNVLVVENGSCDGSEELRTRLLNELSSGKLTPARLDAYGDPQAMFKGFEQALGKFVHNTGKRVLLEDSPWSDVDGARFIELLTVAPRAGSVDEALRRMKAALGEAAALVRRRDEAYASQLSELVRSSPSANILAMLGSGHERALAKYLRARGVAFRSVTQPTTMPSQHRSVALELEENKEHVGRLDLLRCLTEYWPLRSFTALGEDRAALLMKFWIDKRSEPELTEYLSRFYARR